MQYEERGTVASRLVGREPPFGVKGPSPSWGPMVTLFWAWSLSQGSLSPEFWGRGWRNILGLCGDESHSTLPKPFLFQVLDRFKPEPQWDWKVGVRLGEMEFGNTIPLNSKMSGYGKTHILRNSITTETKVQTSGLFQVPVLTLTKSVTLGDHLNLGGSQFSFL